MPHDPSHPLTLRCESCGYIIEGLKPLDPCPECARPIESSLPDSRVGTTWQRGSDGRRQRTGITRRFLRANALMLRHPAREFDVMTIETTRSAALLMANIALAAAVPSVLIAALRAREHFAEQLFFRSVPNVSPALVRSDLSILLEAFIVVVILAPAIMLALWILTGVEQLGLRFWGRRRERRVTKAIAYAVCAHASAGWLLGSMISSIGLALVPFLHHIERAASTLFGPFAANRTEIALRLIPFLGAIIGLLAFETLAYLGARRCRFANAEGSPS